MTLIKRCTSGPLTVIFLPSQSEHMKGKNKSDRKKPTLKSLVNLITPSSPKRSIFAWQTLIACWTHKHAAMNFLPHKKCIFSTQLKSTYSKVHLIISNYSFVNGIILSKLIKTFDHKNRLGILLKLVVRTFIHKHRLGLLFKIVVMTLVHF